MIKLGKNQKLLVQLSIAVAGVMAASWLFSRGSFDVLAAKGPIAGQQRDLIIVATSLMLLIVVPVFVLTAHIAWKYRAGNAEAHHLYKPDWDHNTKLETIWWGFPTAIILVLSVIIWQSSHSLDPFKPIASTKPPITIQVVALQWKWLFIYPQQNIASVNYVQFPEDRPVNFEITADAPMNSFWIPQLGGQVYAMSGMTTKLHLLADEPGSFRGSSANLSGEGFANMHFTAAATPQADFDDWVQSVRKSDRSLSLAEYNQLAMPSKDKIQLSYSSTEPSLHDKIVDKYGTHGNKMEDHR